jgi:hypothetical protein
MSRPARLIIFLNLRRQRFLTLATMAATAMTFASGRNACSLCTTTSSPAGQTSLRI